MANDAAYEFTADILDLAQTIIDFHGFGAEAYVIRMAAKFEMDGHIEDAVKLSIVLDHITHLRTLAGVPRSPGMVH